MIGMSAQSWFMYQECTVAWVWHCRYSPTSWRYMKALQPPLAARSTSRAIGLDNDSIRTSADLASVHSGLRCNKSVKGKERAAQSKSGAQYRL